MLDPDERTRADRFRFAADRHSFIAAHALLRSMLSDATGLPTSTWCFVTGPHGKPALAPALRDRGLQFNISHTRGWVACAIADVAVGVDVEAVDREAAGQVRSVFSRREVRLLDGQVGESMARTFTRLWTLKEAFIKATGEGMHRPLDSFWFELDPVRIGFDPGRYPAAGGGWGFLELAAIPDRCLALAAQHPVPEVDARLAEARDVVERRGPG
jgi:4'-phosphopantetheinyl transferase